MGTTADETKPKSRIENLEDTVLQLIDKIQELETRQDKLEKSTVKKSTGLFGGKRGKVAIKDTKTGSIYPSKASVGKALYAEVEGGDSGDHFMWYKLQAKFPERFVEASDVEANKVWEEEKARMEAEVAEANKKLAAEAAQAEKTKK